MKRTAVEWYENEINALFDKYENKEISKSEFLIMKHNLFYPAKAMEKEQMIDWYATGQADTVHMYEQHLNKTFNTNEQP